MDRSTDPAQARSIALCIDDFGMHEGVNAAALKLVAQGRATALSCLVDGAAWTSGAQALRRLQGNNLDIGLHLNLSESFGGGEPDVPFPMRLPALVVRACIGALDASIVRHAIERQLDRYEQGIGCAPDFVDGHQHVHQLPTVREALVQVLRARYPDRRPWLRCTTPTQARFGKGLKPWLIAQLGARGLSRLAAQAGLPQNAHLLGVYAFDADARTYHQRLRGWLARAGDNDVLMCHPSAPSAAHDALARTRLAEYAVLSGPAFADAMAEAQVRVVPLSRLHGATPG